MRRFSQHPPLLRAPIVPLIDRELLGMGKVCCQLLAPAWTRLCSMVAKLIWPCLYRQLTILPRRYVHLTMQA